MNVKPAPGSILFRLPTRAKLIVLTVDDGPDPATTLAIAECLERHQARATWFVLGARLVEYAPLARQLLQSGHELGNHGWTDHRHWRLPAAEFEQELLACHAQIAAFGTPPHWFRPGGGWFTPAMLRVLRSRDYRCVLGSLWPLDTLHDSPRCSARMILTLLHRGAIVVLHEGGNGGARGRRTATVLHRVLPEVRARGYRCVTLSEFFSGKGVT